MDKLLTLINSQVHEYIDSHSELTKYDTLNVAAQRFKDREIYAPELESLLYTLNKLASTVSNTINDITVAHQRDISTMDQLVTKNKPRDWVSVAKKNRLHRDVSLSAPSVKYDPKPKIKITQSLGLPAVKVVNLTGVKSDGELYYVESLGQFAFKLCGITFRGNIGNLFTDNSESHKKVKDCKYVKTCIKGELCDYYHDPIYTYGSTDKRNFIASSFTYISPDQRRSRYIGKRFGSLEYLDSDIINVSEDDTQKYLDMTTHDVLCSLLLATIR
jgi:hypothetical protein